MTYARYIRSRILTPLKMTSTALDPLPQRLRARRAIGYEPRFLSDELDPAPPDPGVFQAEGGLWSCVEDLARWLSCQFSPEPVLSEETAAEMHKPRYLVDPEWTRAWAIGWYARRHDDVVWIMHSGGHYGFITNACFDPKEKVGAIALLNGFGNATLLAMDLGKIAREAVKAAAPKIEAPAPLPKKWRDLVGLYVMQHFGVGHQPRVAGREAHVPRPHRPDVDADDRAHRRPRRLRDRAGLPRVGRARPLPARQGRPGRLRRRRRVDDGAPRARPGVTRTTSSSSSTRSSRSEFVAERKRLEKSLRDEGRAEEAAEVAKLRKPSQPVFLANRLARWQPDLVAQLIDDGEQLAAAHEAGDPEKLRTAQRDLASRVDALVRIAPGDVSGAIEQRLATLLRAAATQSRHRTAATPWRAVGGGRAGCVRCAGGHDPGRAEGASEAGAQARAGARSASPDEPRSSKASSQRRAKALRKAETRAREAERSRRVRPAREAQLEEQLGDARARLPSRSSRNRQIGQAPSVVFEITVYVT